MNLKLFIIPVFTLLFGCDNNSYSTRTQTQKSGQVSRTDGIFDQTYDLEEFDYKGHTYIGCKVRDGIALTHAGHCKCNKQS